MDEVPRPTQDNVFQPSIKMYRNGANTRYGVVTELVERITPETIDLLPPEFHDDIKDYVERAPRTPEDWDRLRVVVTGSWTGSYDRVLRAISRQERETRERLKRGVETYRSHRMC